MKKVRTQAALAGAGLLLAATSACGADKDGTNAASDVCERFGEDDISVVVPFPPGGGFDAWARLFAPALRSHLDIDAAVKVKNIDGGGGMKGVNTVYHADPDGTTLLFTEPGYVIANQIGGDVLDDFEITNFSYIGSVTQDPDIFYVSADSDMESLEDIRGKQLKHANQQTQPQEIILYDALDVEATYILHPGTSDVILSVRRGDTDASRGSLSSIHPYIESGEIKPIGYLGVGEIGPDFPGAADLADLDNLQTIGREDLAAAFDYRRVLAAPPNTPDCIVETLETGLLSMLDDQDFVQKARAADLVVVPATAAETAENVAASEKAIGEFSEQIKKATQSK